MAFVPLEREKSISQVVRRLYGDLPKADARRAQESLLRDNPHLADLKDLRAGTLIVVRPVPGLPPAAARESGNPAGDAVQEVRDQVEAYLGALADAAGSESAEIKEATGVLGSRDFKAAFEGSEERVKPVAAALKARSAENDQRQAWFKVARKVLADLDDLGK